MSIVCSRSVVSKVFIVFAFILLGYSLLPVKPGHASCGSLSVTNTNDSGLGSLRQAITTANSASGQNTICFAIPGSGVQTIALSSALPAITNPAIIDGSSQPGYNGAPLIELNGTNVTNQPGIWITAGNSTVRGLIINRFGLNGLIITNTGNNIIAGNYIGTDSTGTGAAPNGTDGIGILNSANNTVGGTTVADRNVVSGNTGNGIGITGSAASGNVISGNIVGANSSGTGSIPNHGDGILINQSPNNTVGGTTGTTPGGACTGACNLVSGNRVNGIGIWMPSGTGNTVQGNMVGLTLSGASGLANGDIGVEVNETSGNIVGGTTPGARNVLSGNNGAGVFITGGNAHDNIVQGNYIGTNSAGNGGIGNHKMGLGIGYSPGIQPAHNNFIGSATGATPGGACTGGCNLISGNVQNGVLMSGSGTGGGNTFYNNFIGTSADGVSSIGNGLDGIGIIESANNLIGGTNPGLRNVIAANGNNGLIIVGGTSNGNRFVGNNIGLNTAGNNLGNIGAGVLLASGVDTAILSNNINSNGNLGINLINGANRSPKFPMVYAAKTVNNRTTIGGTINSLPSTSYTLEFFASDGCNAGVPLNFGQGQNFLGSTVLTTDQFGNSVFTFQPTNPVAGNRYITATATKQTNGLPTETSAFSQCLLVNTAKPGLTNGAGTWFLKYDLTPGAADKTFGYGFPSTLLMCAWDPNQKGVKLPVVVSGSNWFERASYTTGTADNQFVYGPVNGTPVCGDWTGSGIDSPGVVGPDSTWYLRNSNSTGAADISFQWGPYGGIPAPGKWTGNGVSTPGMYLPWSDQFIARNSNNGGPADNVYSISGSGLIKQAPGGNIVVGDWTGEGRDKIGWVGTDNVWRMGGNAGGNVIGSFQFGFPGAQPLTW
ncbi:MAG TPA: right-handed parallel beta-helix repeat-containing protein [Patescibacteria group bacterium]|nr:right-handed parallel beta-helix repeat-containing protein [Patescibacteria group bacterium]